VTTTRFRARTFDVDAIQWAGLPSCWPLLQRIEALAGDDTFMVIDVEDLHHGDDPDASAALRDPDHGTWRPVSDGSWIVRRCDTGRVFQLADEAFRAAYEPLPYAVDEAGPRCEANKEGKAAIDRITRRFWHTMQHVLCPMDLDDRIEADTNALRAEFGLPELGRNDIIPDEEVSRCSMHTRGCSGCGWDHADSPPAPSVDRL
jgi:hypothetical protein